MFSTGQLSFAAFFAITFIGVMIYTYRKDLKLHKQNYKGVLWVLLAFLAFIGFIVAIKLIFK